MKKLNSIALAALALVAAASCAKDIKAPAEKTIPQEVKEGFVPMTFNVSFDETKATVDGLKLCFENGDTVAIFDGIALQANKFIVSNANGNSATISGVVSEGATDLYAVYPFSSAVEYRNDSLFVNVPSTQVIPAGKNADPKALVCTSYLAKDANGFVFQKVVDLLKFSFSKDGAQSFKLDGKGDKIVGNVAVDVKNGNAACSGSSSVTVKGAEPLAKGTYYAAVFPGKIAADATIKVLKTDAYGFKTNEEADTLAVNKIYDFGDLDENLDICPNPIMDKEGLLKWATLANKFAIGDEVKLGADIDMNGVEWTSSTTSASNGVTFLGTFDGQNHRIYNFTASTVNNAAQRVGFIGTVGNGTAGTIVKNLCVGSKDYNFETKTGSYDGVSKITYTLNTTKTDYYYGALLAYVHKNTVVENVVNFVNVDITSECNCVHRSGALASTAKDGATLRNCINYGNIVDASTNSSDKALNLGGIVSCLDGAGGTIENCINYGNVTSRAANVIYVGGVIGSIQTNNSTIKGCKNFGRVAYEGNLTINHTGLGGVCGYANKVLTIKDCTNDGTVEFIAGGTLLKRMYAAGILGWSDSNAVTIDGCINNGDVVIDPNGNNLAQNIYTGGITGYIKVANATVQNCESHGNFTAKAGNIKDILNYGGIVGRNDTAKGYIKNCKTSGTITNNAVNNTGKTDTSGSLDFGGILGRTHQATEVSGCTSSCVITNNGKGNNQVCIGGIIGYGQGAQTTIDCSFTGTITANEAEGGKAGAYGGFFGRKGGSTLSSCSGITVNAKIDIKKAPAGTAVGGLFGMCNNIGDPINITKVDVTAVITGAETEYAGILVGNTSLGLNTTGTVSVMNIGADGDPVKYAGSLNGVAASADNLVGSSSVANTVVIK